MGALSIWHILALGAVAVLLFGGRGRISDLMGDVAKGVKGFRHGLNDPVDIATISGPPAEPTAPSKDQVPIGR